MLEELTIKNVAVIDKLNVTFDKGLSVLTGETGAGKSIIIDSINMILGDRARKELIRGGTEFAQVEAVFGMNDAVREILAQNDIDCDDDNVIITRKITVDGKSSARINGSAVTLNALRDISDMLINIHGQHDNQALLTPHKHITFLDSFAKTDSVLDEYRSTYEKRNKLKKELERLLENVSGRIERADLLAYHVNEITAANLAPGEEEELISERNLLANAEEINECVAQAVTSLYDSDEGASAYDRICEAQNALGRIADVSDVVREAYDAITSAMYTIEESARDIRDFGSGVEFDEQALIETEERLDLLNRLKRKYGGTVEAVIEYGKKAQEELSEIETSDERADEIKKQLAECEAQLKTVASELTKVRKTAAMQLQTEIETALYELNMEKAKFSVNIAEKEFSSDGADAVEFLISTNPGEDLKPLVKIASGGELSRVMLAIKSILAKSDAVDAMIFDEIDTGVSGSAAQKIADKLKTIAESAQVICITHLPQLASVADTHFLIEKDVDGEMAKTTLVNLDKNGRIAELARIVGGGSAGEEYARRLLQSQWRWNECRHLKKIINIT